MAEDFTPTKLRELKKHPFSVVTLGFLKKESDTIGLSVMEGVSSRKAAEALLIVQNDWAVEDIAKHGDVFYVNVLVANPGDEGAKGLKLRSDAEHMALFGGDDKWKEKVSSALVADPDLILARPEGRPAVIDMEDDESPKPKPPTGKPPVKKAAAPKASGAPAKKAAATPAKRTAAKKAVPKPVAEKTVQPSAPKKRVAPKRSSAAPAKVDAA